MGLFLKPETNVVEFLQKNTWSSFYKSLLDQYDKNGQLSQRQIECIENAMLKDAARRTNAALPPEQRQFSLKLGTKIEVKAWLARRLGRELNMEVFFRNLEVMEVCRETSKAYEVKVKFVSTIVTSCHVCGRELDTDVSRAVGIGPVCADKLGIPRPTLENAHETLKLIDAKCSEIGTLGPFWIPKSQIKNSMEVKSL